MKRPPGLAPLALAVYSLMQLPSVWAQTTSTTTSASPTPAAPDPRPVTQDQFRRSVEFLKKMWERQNATEKKLQGMTVQPPPKGGEEVVDLSSLSTDETPLASGKSPVAKSPHHQGPLGIPGFKVYFDFDLINRPGIEDLSFDNYHSFLLFEISPTPDIQFSFDVNPTPKYYELDLAVTQKLQFRAGKIWVPFDDLGPHNIFGGRVNVSRLAQGSAFLPDLWTDLGVGLKYQLVDTPKISMVAHAYAVNGFRSGGSDLSGKDPNPENYPSFADLSLTADNNRDKAIGGRLHTLFYNKFGLGLSYYKEGRWTSESSSFNKGLTISGMDSQLRLGRTEVRTGLISMKIDLPNGDSFKRGGWYLELGQKFGSRDQWKVLGRTGALQFDDRVVNLKEDEKLVGGTLLWKPSLIEYSIEHSRDLEKSSKKKSYSYTAFRIIIAL